MLLNNGTIIKEGLHFFYKVIGKTETCYILEQLGTGEQELMKFKELDLVFHHTIVHNVV